MDDCVLEASGCGLTDALPGGRQPVTVGRATVKALLRPEARMRLEWRDGMR